MAEENSQLVNVENVELEIPWEQIKQGKLDEVAIENVRVEVMKQVQDRRRRKMLIVERINQISKGITNLEQRKRDLTTARQKCQTVIDIMEADAEILRGKFWEAKGK